MPETQPLHAALDVLARIVATKREEVARLRSRAGDLDRSAAVAPAPRGFEGALRRDGEVALVAEVKRRSPGAGSILPALDPVALATGYARAGAAAVSVLTDREYFGGGLDDLRAVKAHVPVPVLRKDFTIDPLQVAEARGAGADAVLLIVRILEDALLADLLAAARHHDLAALVEVHERRELDRALKAGARILGINNRDLRTFTTDVDVTLRLLREVPEDAVVVSESGIRTRDEVERLGREGVHAVLVGETLLRADDPEEAAGDLSGCARRERVRG